MSTCKQPFLIISDGTGRTLVYSCHLPPELTPTDGNLSTTTKSAPTKPISLEPVIELEKCPIYMGPLTSKDQSKPEDQSNKKKPLKKKPIVPSKGRLRAKSPSATPTPEPTHPVEIPRNQAVVYIINDVAVLRFGVFPILFIYPLDGSSYPICEFDFPSPISASYELRSQIIIGLENGSFCMLNVPRRTLHSQVFPKQGSIVGIEVLGNILITFSSNKVVSAYKLGELNLERKLYTLSDDDILSTHASKDTLFTLNAKSSDLTIVFSLTSNLEWEERQIVELPNVSVIDPRVGQYLGTAASPINMDLVQTLKNGSQIVFIYNDPIECTPLPTATREPQPAPTKRIPSPKGKGSKKGKVARMSKKGDESRDNDQGSLELPKKRYVMCYLNLDECVGSFRAAMIEETCKNNERRALLKSMSSRSLATFANAIRKAEG